MRTVLRALGLDRFARDESGSLSVYVVIILPALFMLMGIAVDMSLLNFHRRYAQAQADLAAMSAVLHLRTAEEARTAARATVAANDAFEALPLADSQIVLGRLDADRRFVPAADQSDVAGVSAVSVQVLLPPTFPVLERFMSFGDPVVVRAAVAEQLPRVSFSLSNCLLSLNLYGSLIEPMTHGSLQALCSGQGARVDAFELLGALSVHATGLTPGSATYGDVLDAQIRYTDILSEVLGRRVTPGDETVRLGDILYLDEELRRLRIGAPVPPLQVQAGDVVFGGFELLHHNLADLAISLRLGSANAAARLSILEPHRIVIGAVPSDPEAFAQTSQVRLAIDPIRIGTAFDLTLNLEVANASARLADARCGREPGDLAARFQPVDASLLDLELGVAVLGLPVVPASRGTRSTRVLASETRAFDFTRQEVDQHRVVQFGPGISTSVTGLIRDLRTTTAGLLDLVRNDAAKDMPACTGLLGCILNGVAATLDGVLRTLADVTTRVRNDLGPEGAKIDNTLQDLFQLGVAQGQLEVLSVECSSRLAI